MRLVRSVAVLLTGVVVASCGAWGAIVNVPGDYPGIQQAINAAAPGDTVQVAEGTWNESIDIRKSLTLQGAGPGLTVLDGNHWNENYYMVRINADNVTVSGFTITNPAYIGTADASGILIGSESRNTGITITNCEICDLGPAGRYPVSFGTFGINCGPVENLEVSGCLIHNIWNGDPDAYAIGVFTWGNDDIQTTANVTIRGNVIHDMANPGSIATGVSGGFFGTDIWVCGNEIYNVKMGISVGNEDYPAGPLYVVGNAVHDASVYGIRMRSPLRTVVAANDLTGNGVGVYVTPRADPSVGEIHFNRIAGNTLGLQNASAQAANAGKNWWGAAEGPGSAGGDTVDGLADVVPWLASDLRARAFAELRSADPFTLEMPEGPVRAEGTATGAAGALYLGAYVSNPGADFEPVAGWPDSFFDVFLSNPAAVSGDGQNGLALFFEYPVGVVPQENPAFWFDGSRWLPCSDQTVVPFGQLEVAPSLGRDVENGTPGGYVRVFVSDATSPTLAQLTGTPFGMGRPIYAITATAVGRGTVTPEGRTVFEYGDTQTYAIVPDAQYGIVDVTVDGVSVGPVTEYTFAAIDRSHTIRAVFSNIYIMGYIKTPSGVGMEGVTVAFSGAGAATTLSSGYYSKLVPAGYSGTAVPSQAGAAFSPVSRSYSNVLFSKAGQNYAGGITVSGYVRTPSGAGIAGATVTLDNGGGSATSDASGYYACFVASGWTGCATPAKAGATFEPPRLLYADVVTPRTNQIYVGYVAVSGYVRNGGGAGLAGVELTFSNGGGSATTDGTGYYKNGSVPYGWTGSVTPALAGYSFVPAAISYAGVTTSPGNQNYTGKTSYTISGTVTENGAPLAGVTVTFSNGGGTATTDGTGYYEREVQEGWSGTATPGKASYNFNPASRSYTAVWADQPGQNYTAQAVYIISGRVRTPSGAAVGGVTVTYAGTFNGGTAYGGSANTNTSGYYEFGVPGGWTGTASAAKTNYIVTTPAKSYTNVSANAANQDYTAVAAVIITGYVKAGLRGVADAIVTASGGYSGTSNSAGYYSVTVPSGWSGTLTPALAGYTFIPASRTYGATTVNKAGQNFTAVPAPARR